MKMDRETLIITILVLGLFMSSIYLGIENREAVMEIARALYGMGEYLGGGKLTFQTKIFLFFIIWARNTLVAALNITLGPILGLFPIFTVIINGFIIGGVVSAVAEQISVEAAFKGIAPHGIIELPTFIYSAIIGIKLGKKAYDYRFKGRELTNMYISSLKLIPKYIVPLLMIAALIEAFITTALLGL